MSSELNAGEVGVGRDHVSMIDVAATALAATLFVLAFPQFGDAWGLDWLIWVALAPFFYVVTSRGPRAGLLLGFFLGFAIEGSGFIWIYHAIESFTQSPPALSALLFCLWLVYAAAAWSLLGLALGSCRSQRGMFWVLPLWVGLEHYLPRLWPWHVGGALYSREWLLQAVDLVGTSGLTAVVFLANGVLALVVGCAARRNAFPGASSVVLVTLVIGVNVYGALRLESARRFEATRSPLDVMLVQGALDSRERSAAGLRIYKERTTIARRGRPAPVDLVVWPEGAIAADGLAFDLTRGADPWGWFERLGVPRVELDVPLVAGATGVVRDRRPRVSNLTVYLVPGEPARFYEKMVRVPFGEVVPGLDLLPESWVRAWRLQVGTIAPGTENPLFRLHDVPFRNLTCYEAILPGFVRRHAPGAEFYVNITEDVWYGRTASIPQHVSVLILRAVENRIPIVRCCNMGPSGVVSVSGSFDRGDEIFAPEIVVKTFRPGRMRSLHERGGYLFPLAMLLVAFSRFAITMRRRS